MSKIPVNHIAAVGVIHRAQDPREIFTEMKDRGHPMPMARGRLCCIGGNWIGPDAKGDRGPRGTFTRAMEQEISFDRPVRSATGRELLGLAKDEHFAPTPISGIQVTANDEAHLCMLKQGITELAQPFGDFVTTISTSVLDAADPGNTREGFSFLGSYFAVPLPEDVWSVMLALQEKFGNLSNSSMSLVTSLDQIIATNTRWFAHDRVMQQFFREMGFVAAEQLPLVPGISSVRVGIPLDTYAEYLDRYDVAKMPA